MSQTINQDRLVALAAEYETIAQKRAAVAIEQASLAQRQIALGHRVARNLRLSIGFALLSAVCTLIASSHHFTHAVH